MDQSSGSTHPENKPTVADDSPDEFVVVARLGRPHGVRGWQHIQSYTEPWDHVREYADLFRRVKKQWVALGEVGWQLHHSNLLIKLPDVNSPEEARNLAKTEVAVPASALPQLEDPDEFYWRDLQGCLVTNQQALNLGVVKEIMETGAHDVLVIQGENRQILIPFTQQHVLEVDLKQRSIRVDWQEDW